MESISKHDTSRLLKRWLFAAQDIFSDNASVRAAEKSQIFRALHSPRVIRGKNMIRTQSHRPSFSATCQTAGIPVGASFSPRKVRRASDRV
jgi:hypothetical protein